MEELVLRLKKADALALNKARALHLNTKICPVLTANTKENTRGGGSDQRSVDHFVARVTRVTRIGSVGPVPESLILLTGAVL